MSGRNESDRRNQALPRGSGSRAWGRQEASSSPSRPLLVGQGLGDLLVHLRMHLRSAYRRALRPLAKPHPGSCPWPSLAAGESGALRIS